MQTNASISIQAVVLFGVGEHGARQDAQPTLSSSFHGILLGNQDPSSQTGSLTISNSFPLGTIASLSEELDLYQQVRPQEVVVGYYAHHPNTELSSQLSKLCKTPLFLQLPSSPCNCTETLSLYDSSSNKLPYTIVTLPSELITINHIAASSSLSSDTKTRLTAYREAVHGLYQRVDRIVRQIEGMPIICDGNKIGNGIGNGETNISKEEEALLVLARQLCNLMPVSSTECDGFGGENEEAENTRLLGLLSVMTKGLGLSEKLGLVL